MTDLPTDYPTSPDALTAEWLSRALQCPVADFEVEHFSEGAGVIGLVTRLKLIGEETPATVIAKFPSPAPENRAVAGTYDMYGREVRFYQNTAPRLALRTAHCYYGAHDPETQAFILLLEDLRDYRIGDQVAGCSLAEATAVVDAIAELHAYTWNGKGLEDLDSHNSPMQRDGMIAGFKMGWPVVAEQFADLIPASARTVGECMPDAIGSLLDQMCTAPVALSHADVRLDNIFFGATDATANQIVLVDWQSVCTSAPEQDLAYFLTQSVPRAVNEQQDLVARYHQTLTRHGIDYPLSQCRERFRISALYLLCYAVVIAGTLDMGNARGQALARTLLGNSLRALDRMHAFELLD